MPTLFHLSDASNPQLYYFADELATPDHYFTQEYTASHKGKRTPIVIDNGTVKYQMCSFLYVAKKYLIHLL